MFIKVFNISKKNQFIDSKYITKKITSRTWTFLST